MEDALSISKATNVSLVLRGAVRDRYLYGYGAHQRNGIASVCTGMAVDLPVLVSVCAAVFGDGVLTARYSVP